MIRKAILLGLGALAAYAIARWQLAGRMVEEPAFAVERALGAVQIRRYEPCVRAQTVVEAPTDDDAVRAGFRRLAGYIFGGNARAEKISMTAPVTQAGEKIPMTAPVTQAAAGAGRWLVTFTMPRGRTLADLPRPTDAAVSLQAVPSRHVAALRYSGTTPPARVQEKERELRGALARAGLAAPGVATSARYDPPSVLPFLRRNEVWLELDDVPASTAP